MLRSCVKEPGIRKLCWVVAAARVENHANHRQARPYAVGTAILPLTGLGSPSGSWYGTFVAAICSAASFEGPPPILQRE